MKKQYCAWTIILIMLGLPFWVDAALKPMPPTAYRTGTMEQFQVKPPINTSTIEKESKGFFKRLVDRGKSIPRRKIEISIVSILAGVLVIFIFGFLIVYSGYFIWILLPSLFLIGIGLHWGGRGMKHFFKNKGEVADNPKKSKRRRVLIYLAGVVVTGILAVLITLFAYSGDRCFMCLD
jgi:hypothetical protein